MRRLTAMLACAAWMLAAGAALGAEAPKPAVVDQVKKSRQDLLSSTVSAPEGPSAEADLSQTAQRLRAILEQAEARASAPAEATAAPAGPPARPDPPAVPALSAEELARIKDLSTKRVADPLALADALFLGGHYAEACAFYERILSDAATAADAKPWILFQMANCQRRRDPAAAIVLYDRLLTEHPKCAWAEAAKSHRTLLDWYQTATPAEALKPQAPTPAPSAPKGKAP